MPSKNYKITAKSYQRHQAVVSQNLDRGAFAGGEHRKRKIFKLNIKGVWPWEFFQKLPDIVAELNQLNSNYSASSFDPKRMLSLMLNHRSRDELIKYNEEKRKKFENERDIQIRELELEFKNLEENIMSDRVKGWNKILKNETKKFKNNKRRIQKQYEKNLQQNNLRELNKTDLAIYNNLKEQDFLDFDYDMKNLLKSIKKNNDESNTYQPQTDKCNKFKLLKKLESLLPNHEKNKKDIFSIYQKMFKKFDMSDFNIFQEDSKNIELQEIWNETLNIVEDLGDDRIMYQFNDLHNEQPPLDDKGFRQVEKFQEDIVWNIYKGKSSLVVAPTSSGKTVAATFMCIDYHKEFYRVYDNLKRRNEEDKDDVEIKLLLDKIKKKSDNYQDKDISYDNKKVLVVVPTEALAWQWAKDLTQIYDCHIPHITDHHKTVCCDREGLLDFITDAPALIGTPSTLVNILTMKNSSGENLEFTHVIYDEIHMIDEKQCREMEIIIRLLVGKQFLALSATIGNVESFRDWIINVGYEKDKVDIISCNKRFFNLEKSFWDMNKKKSVVISPLSLVKINEFENETIRDRDLKPTPPNIWKIAMSLKDIFGDDGMKYIYTQNQKDKDVIDSIRQISSENLPMGNKGTKVSWQAESHKDKDEIEIEIDCNPFRYFKRQDRITLDESNEYHRNLIELMIYKTKNGFKEEIEEILKSFEIVYDGKDIIDISGQKFRLGDEEHNNNTIFESLINIYNLEHDVSQLREMMMKELKNKIDNKDDNFINYILITWKNSSDKLLISKDSKKIKKNLIKKYNKDIIDSYVKIMSKGTNCRERYSDDTFNGVSDFCNGLYFELESVLKALKKELKVIYLNEEREFEIKCFNCGEDDIDVPFLFYNGAYFRYVQDYNEKEQFTNKDNIGDLVDLLFDSKKNDKLPCIIFVPDTFECQRTAVKFLQYVEKMEELNDPDRLSKINKALKEEKKKRNQEERLENDSKKKSNGDDPKSKYNKDAKMFKNSKKVDIDNINKLDDSDDNSLSMLLEPNEKFIFSSSQSINNDIINKIFKDCELNKSYDKEKGAHHIFLRCLKRGVGVIYERMPQKYRKTVLDLYTKKSINVIFSDTSLAFGVNSPTKHVILYQSANEKNSKLGPMLTNQMIGRAGRRGVETVGYSTSFNFTYEECINSLAPVIPKISGVIEDFTDLPISVDCASKLNSNFKWDNIKKNYLNNNLNKLVKRKEKELQRSEILYGLLQNILARTFISKYKYYGEDEDKKLDGYISPNWYQLLWELRDTGCALQVAYIIPKILEMFDRINGKLESSQVKMASFLCTFLLTDEIESNTNLNLYYNRDEDKNKIIDYFEVTQNTFKKYRNDEIFRLIDIDKIDGRLWQSIRDNRIKIYEDGLETTVKIWNKLFYFTDKVIRPIEHYFYYEFGLKRFKDITVCLSKLCTRCYYIYLGASPIKEKFRNAIIGNYDHDIDNIFRKINGNNKHSTNYKTEKELKKIMKNFTKSDIEHSTSEDIIDSVRKISAENLPIDNGKNILWQAEDNVRDIKCEIEI